MAVWGYKLWDDEFQNVLSSLLPTDEPWRVQLTMGALNTLITNNVFPCSVTKERTEVVFEGTLDRNPGQNGEMAQWKEFEFKCKPGSVDRRPCIISPYHYRLDWLMWFAAFQVREGNVWTASCPVCKLGSVAMSDGRLRRLFTPLSILGCLLGCGVTLTASSFPAELPVQPLVGPPGCQAVGWGPFHQHTLSSQPIPR